MIEGTVVVKRTVLVGVVTSPKTSAPFGRSQVIGVVGSVGGSEPPPHATTPSPRIAHFMSFHAAAERAERDVRAAAHDIDGLTVTEREREALVDDPARAFDARAGAAVAAAGLGA